MQYLRGICGWAVFQEYNSALYLQSWDIPGFLCLRPYQLSENPLQQFSPKKDSRCLCKQRAFKCGLCSTVQRDPLRSLWACGPVGLWSGTGAITLITSQRASFTSTAALPLPGRALTRELETRAGSRCLASSFLASLLSFALFPSFLLFTPPPYFQRNTF